MVSLTNTAQAAADPKGVTLELQDPEPADEGPGSPTEVPLGLPHGWDPVRTNISEVI